MSFIAIVAATPEGRVAKYAEFDARQDADAHVARFGGFAVPNPGAPWSHWRLNPAQKVITIDPPTPTPTPRREDPRVTAIKRLAAATGTDLSDLDL